MSKKHIELLMLKRWCVSMSLYKNNLMRTEQTIDFFVVCFFVELY